MINILTENNAVGLKQDALLLHNLFLKNNIQSSIYFWNEILPTESSDIGVWIQDVIYEHMDKFSVNILYINEEWYIHDIEKLSDFDYVICKSKYAKNTFFKNIDNVYYIPFISKSLYNPLFLKNTDYKFLHFMGRSIQKNTESIFGIHQKITLHDPHNTYTNLPGHINHISSYLNDLNIECMLNKHNTHICCSLYESWGHYLFEGLSTGANIICSDIPVFREQLDEDLVHFLPVTKKMDTNYKYCSEDAQKIYPLREAHFIHNEDLYNLLQNFYIKGSNIQRRDLFRHIVKNGEQKIIDFFKNI